MATIQNEDWNPIQTKIKNVLSTPDGTTNNLGYNTSYSSAQVADDQIITGAQWNNLRADINKAYLLQTGANSDLTTRDSTSIITADDLTTISAKADTAETSRGSVSTGQLTYVAGPAYSSTDAWGATLTPINATITFVDNAAYRGFWNGGGRIVISGSRSGGATNSQNQSWTNLLTNMGTLTLTRTGMSQSGTWNGTFYNSWGSGGVYGTTHTAWVEAFRLYGQDTNYTPNYVQVYMYHNNTDIKLRTSLSILIYYADDHAASGAGPDTIDGTTTCSCAIYYPYSTAKPNNY